MNRVVSAFVFALALAGVSGPSIAADGADLYKSCKACHLANGKGVPGAFPPLGAQIAALSKTPEGRTYLPLVIKRGMIGALKVDGKTYRGAMPARPRYDAGDLAALLNYILDDIVGEAAEGVKPYSGLEIVKTLKAYPDVRGAAVLAMRPDLSKPKGEPAAETTTKAVEATVEVPKPAPLVAAAPKVEEEPAEEKAEAAGVSTTKTPDPGKTAWAAHLESLKIEEK